MPPYKIVLADDHLLIREMLKAALERIPEFKVTAEVGDGAECLDVLKDAEADMVLLDIAMPRMHGLEVIKEIKTVYPGIKVLVLTMHKSKLHISRAFAAGADGYLLKENAFDDLLTAIDKVRHGESYISDLISCQVMELFREGSFGDGAQPTKPLTTREKEILELVVEGRSAREIADSLSVSIMTVYNHRINIKKKLGAKKDIDLIKRAMQDGYVHMQPSGSI